MSSVKNLATMLNQNIREIEYAMYMYTDLSRIW